MLIAVYLCLMDDSMLKEVFKRERRKATWKNPVRETEIAMEEVGHSLSLLEGEVILDGKRMEGKPQEIRQRVTQQFKDWRMQMLVKEYEKKVVKSVIWKEIRTTWLARIRGKAVGDIRCWLCKKSEEGLSNGYAAASIWPRDSTSRDMTRP